MEPRFLGFYERELKHVRELGGEFARLFPKVAGRLGLDAFACGDPYVERLIEAFAFLTARIQLKLSAEQGEFTQQLLELLQPAYLAPTPSMAVVQLQPNARQGSLMSGITVPRGASLRSALGEQQTACEYRTGHAVTLWPVEIEAADYRTRMGDLVDLERVALPGAKAALRVVLRATRGATFDKLPLEALPLFLRGGGEVARCLYEQLLGAPVALIVQSAERPCDFVNVVRGPSVAPLGFEADQALLPSNDRGFEGYRLLHEYFAFPERFMFAEVRRLQEAMRGSRGSRVELILLFDRAEPRLEGVVNASHLALYCTPAINLFPRTSDRIALDERDHEHHVVPDRTRPLDFEVHSVTKVQGYGADGSELCEFLPLYAGNARTAGQSSGARYTVRRQPRELAPGWFERDHDQRSPYVPSESFVATVDGKHGAARPGLRQLAVSTLCTNRALPLGLRLGTGNTDFREQSGAPIESVRCVAGPTSPRSSPVHGDLAWRLLSHLSLDYMTLMRRDGGSAAALQGLLGLYANLSDRSGEAQVAGLLDVRTMGIVRPLPVPGPISFARGTEVTLTCDEMAFQGTGAFLLGAVLQRFFAKYASINSFTETVLCTQQRGEVMRWPAIAGRRNTL